MNALSEPKEQEADGARMISRLAARVAEVRKLRGLPRRVLSERSGISPRYLAQLEAGEGNISILLLQRVARALDVSVETLLAEKRVFDHDAERIGILYRKAPPEVQSRVRGLLTPQAPQVLRAGRICLIGLRGAGKSTLGRMVGETLNIPFVELNLAVEEAAGMPLSEIMAFYGESGYRKLEADALERVSMKHDRMILAVAGGIVAEPTTYARLLERFNTVWVRTSPAEHMQRVRGQGDLRPMEGNPEAMAHLKELLASREPLYARAEAQLDTAGRTARTSLNDLLAIIANRKFLDGGA